MYIDYFQEKRYLLIIIPKNVQKKLFKKTERQQRKKGIERERDREGIKTSERKRDYDREMKINIDIE